MIPPPQEFYRMVASSGDDDTIRIDFVDEESAAYIEAFRQVVFEIDSEIKHLNSRSKQTGIAANNASEMKEQLSGFEAKNENIKTIAKLVVDKINSFGTVCDPLQLRITRMYQDMTLLDQTLDVYKSQVMLLDGEVRKEEDGNVTFQPNADLNESGNEESHQEIEPVLQEYIRKTVHDTMKESEQQMNQRWRDQNKMMSDQNKAVTDRMKKTEDRMLSMLQDFANTQKIAAEQRLDDCENTPQARPRQGRIQEPTLNRQPIRSTFANHTSGSQLHSGRRYIQSSIDHKKRLAVMAQVTSSGQEDWGAFSGINPAWGKLPIGQIKIPIFDGTPGKFLYFWNRFKPMIHDRRDLRDWEKALYLQDQLRETPHRLISGILESAGGYVDAIHALLSRYGPSAQTTDELVQAVRELPQPSKNQFALMTENCIAIRAAAFKISQVDRMTYRGNILVDIIEKKFPREIVNSAYKSGIVHDAMSLVSEIQFAIDTEELLQRPEVRNPIQQNQNQERIDSGEEEDDQDYELELSEDDVESGKQDKRQLRCVFCSNEHQSAKCDLLTTVDMRKKLLNGLRLCYNCLKQGHSSRECQSEERCRRCNWKHHEAICSTLDFQEGGQKARRQ